MEDIESSHRSIDFDLDLGSPLVSDQQHRLHGKTSMNIRRRDIDEVAAAISPASINDISDGTLHFALDEAKPHATLMRDASKWILDLETLRDEMHIVSVKNAILLDSLAMAGADV